MRMLLVLSLLLLCSCTKYVAAECPKPAALPGYFYENIPPAVSEEEMVREMVIRYGECRERVKVLDAALDAYR